MRLASFLLFCSLGMIPLARSETLVGQWVEASRLDPCGEFPEGKRVCFEISQEFLSSKDPETKQRARQVEEGKEQLPLFSTNKECLKSIPIELHVLDPLLNCKKLPDAGYAFDYVQNDCVELANCGCRPGHRLNSNPNRLFLKIFHNLGECLSAHPEGRARPARVIEKIKKTLR